MSFTLSAQPIRRIGIKVNDQCKTNCTAPITFGAEAHIDDDVDCIAIDYASSIPEGTFWLYFPDCDLTPEETITIYIYTWDASWNMCCLGYYEGHWHYWGEEYYVDLENY